jgi:hypothetical protein
LVLHLTCCFFYYLADGQPVASAVQLSSGDKVQQVVALPKQVHFHAHSEHLISGEQTDPPCTHQQFSGV